MLTAATYKIGITVARANMAAAPETVSVTIPKAQLAEAARLAAESRRDPQAVLEELLEESIRMRRVPGIVFADGAKRAPCSDRRHRPRRVGDHRWVQVSGMGCRRTQAGIRLARRPSDRGGSLILRVLPS